MEIPKKFKRALLLFYPNRYFFEVYKSNNEILKDLSYIRQIPSYEAILDKLLSLFLDIDKDKIQASSYTKQKLLRTIKVHIKQYRGDKLKNETRNILFRIFKKYVFLKTYSNLVNNILIDILLNKEQISWLLKNHTYNIHILNRILRYPKRQENISKWAQNHYKNQVYMDRRAELLGLFISNPLQPFVKTNEIEMLYWGIYYSKIADKDKKALLEKYYNPDYVDQWITVVIRLRYSGLLTNKV